MTSHESGSALLLGILLSALSLTLAAPPPGTTVLPPVDLSPGADVRMPGSLALNRATHKLYVGGEPGSITGLKVIDTTNNTVLGGFTFGAYPGASPLRGFAMAVDQSAGPDGNKLYVVGKPSEAYVLRVIDGATNKELTGSGTEIVLPMEPLANETFGIVVNPTNHKVYVSTSQGQIVVVDGVQRKVVANFNPDAGGFLALDPVANRVFVLGANGGAIIESATDTVSAPPKPLLFKPTSAVFNEVDQRIYLGGYRPGPTNSYGIFVLNGSTGRLAASKTYPQVQRSLEGITIVPQTNRVYAGSAFQIFSFDTSDLSLNAVFAQPGAALAFDPAGPGPLLTAESVFQVNDNAVHLVNRATGKSAHRTTAYQTLKIAVNTTTNRLYVLDSVARDLVVLDGADRSIVARVTLAPAAFPAARDIAVSERLNRIYVTRLTPQDGTDSPVRMVDVYDGATNRLLRSFPVQNAGIIAVDDTRRHLYFAGFRPTSSTEGVPFLDIYDEDSEAFLKSIDTKKGSFATSGVAVAVNRVSGKVYMAGPYGGVSVFDGASLTLVKDPVDTGSTTPRFLGVNSVTNKIYAVDRDGISVIDGVTDLVTASFKAGGNHSGARGLTGIAVDEEADTINITDIARDGQNYVDRLLTLQGQGNHALLGAVPVRYPNAGPYFNPATRQMFVPDVRHGAIKVIQAGDATP